MRLKNGNTLFNNSFISRLYNSISIKNISILYLIYSIIFYANPVFALDLGGWVKTATSRSGASSTYNGSRSYNPNYAGSSSISSIATIVPLAVDVTAMILRPTGWGLVITAAGLLYQGYEWSEDFKNNRIKGTPNNSNNPQQYQYYYQLSRVPNGTITVVYTASQVQSLSQQDYDAYALNNDGNNYVYTVTASLQSNGDILRTVVSRYVPTGHTNTQVNTLTRYNNSSYNPNYVPSTTPIYVPLDDVSQKIIDMANTNNAEAVVFLGTVSDSAWSTNPATIELQNKLTNALNKNAQHPSDTVSSSVTTTTASSTSPNPASGTTTTTSSSNTTQTLPAFCKYASKLCDWLDWTQELPTDKPDKDTKVPEKELKIDVDIKKPNESLIVFFKSCPAPVDIPISLFGNTNHLTISYTPLCDFLSMLKPFLIACAYISAGYIILGLSRGK